MNSTAKDRNSHADFCCSLSANFLHNLWYHTLQVPVTSVSLSSNLLFLNSVRPGFLPPGPKSRNGLQAENHGDAGGSSTFAFLLSGITGLLFPVFHSLEQLNIFYTLVYLLIVKGKNQLLVISLMPNSHNFLYFFFGL